MHDRSQRFILPLIELCGLREVPLKSRIIHDLASRENVIDNLGCCSSHLSPTSERQAGPFQEKALKTGGTTRPGSTWAQPPMDMEHPDPTEQIHKTISQTLKITGKARF